jgi:hypothetical protein
MIICFNFFKSHANIFHRFVFLNICICLFSCNSPKKDSNDNQLLKKSNQNFDDTLMHQFLYVDSCVFRLKETHGWESDPNPEQMADNISTLVTYHPTLLSLQDKNMLIYVNVISKDYLEKNSYCNNFEGYLQGEKRLALSLGEIVTDTKAIVTMDSTKAICRRYYNKNESCYYNIGYIDYTGYVIIITMSARSEKDLIDNTSAFYHIVRSYKKVNMTVIDSTNSQDYISN